jgi:hypothetical protein
MFGSLLVATGLLVLALPLDAAIILAIAGMVALACAFGHLVLQRLTSRPLAAIIMITLGLGALCAASPHWHFNGFRARSRCRCRPSR